MAKIVRKNQLIFAGNATNNGQFGSAQVGTKQLSNDPDVLQALGAWGSGWDDATISAQNLPPLEEMQALDFINTYQLAYIFQEGIPEWNIDAIYFENSIVKKTGTMQLYGSLTDNNIGNALTDPTNWSFLVDLAVASASGIPTAVAGGTGDALTATFTTISLVDRQLCVVRASAANTITNPTFSPNGLLAHTITKLGGQALSPGDIPAANADIFLCYDLPNTRWELLNPAGPRGNWCVAGGSADAITGTYAPAVVALYDGLQLFFRASANNATTTPTYAPNGLTAHPITKKGGGALAANDIVNLGEFEIRYNLANTRWELYNPASATAATVTSVSLSLPAMFTVSGSPVTSSGTLTAVLANESANLIFAGPGTGAAAAPTFRALVNADLPAQGGITPGVYRNANVTVNQQGIVTSISQTTGSDFLSTNHPLLIASSITIAHGLPAAPSSIAVELVCDTPQGGWNTGDIIPHCSGAYDNITQEGQIQFTASYNDTNITIVTQGSAYEFVKKDGTGHFTMTPGNWHIRARAWL